MTEILCVCVCVYCGFSILLSSVSGVSWLRRGNEFFTIFWAQLKDYVGPLNKLLQIYELPQLPVDAPDSDIFAALQCVHTRVCPPDEPTKMKLDLDTLPIAMSSDDPQVTTGLRSLR